MNIRSAFLTFFLLLYTCSGAAQFSLQGSSYTVEDGIPDNWVLSAMLDKDGYMWFGTAYGLSRFDGKNFINYYENENDPFALSSLFICDILQHEDGTIWLATLGGGLNCLDPSTATFKDYPTDTSHFGQDGEALLICALERMSDTLWFGCYNTGLGAFDLKNRKFLGMHDIPFDSTFSNNSFAANTIWDIERSKKKPNTLWLAGKERGIIRFDTKTRKMKCYQVEDYFGVPRLCVFGVHEDDKGIVWAGTYGKGVVRFDPETEEIEAFPYAELENKLQMQLTNYVTSICKKSDTELWIGTGDKNFGIFNTVTHAYQFYDSKQVGENPTLHAQIESVFSDDKNRLWVLGKKDGIQKYDMGRQLIEYHSLPSIDCSFEEQGVSDFSYSKVTDELYMSTRSCGLFKYNFSTKKTNKLTVEASTLPNFYCVLKDSKGGIWAGSGKYGHGNSSLFYAKNEKDALKPYRLSQDIYLEETINDIFEDSKGRIWIGTDGMGLYVYNPTTKKTINLNEEFNLPFWSEYLEVKENPEGEIYLALRNGGLLIWSPDLKSYKRFTEPELPIGRINSGEYDDNGAYWLSPGNMGLCHYSVREPDKLPKKVLLNGLVVSKVLKSEDGKIWMATEKGLGQYNPVTLDFEMYSKSEGLANPYLVSYGFAKIPDYGLVIGQPNGFAIMPFKNQSGNKKANKVSITDLKVFNRSVFYEKNILANKSINLEHDENMLSFQIGWLNYLDNTLLSFKYKLEGLEDTWHEPIDGSTITYSKLDPGTYEMVIVPIDSNGSPSGEETRLAIVIAPAWWQTQWFKILLFLLSLGSVISLTAYYVRTKERIRYAELEKTREVERVRTGIAQDIHDDIGAQLTRMSMLAELAALTKEKDSNKLISKLKKIGQESRSAAANLREVVFAVNPESDTFEDLQAYLQDASNRFLEDSGLNVVFRFPKPLINSSVSPAIKRQVSMILRESLNNTIKHAHASSVEVSFVLKDADTYELVIKDDGTGFNINSQNGISHGMSGMQKRAKLVSGTINVTSCPNGTTIIMHGPVEI